MKALISSQAHLIDLYESTLEAERQWRLRSLPALLAAEAKAARCVCQRDDVQAAPELGAVVGRTLLMMNGNPMPDLAASRHNRP